MPKNLRLFNSAVSRLALAVSLLTLAFAATAGTGSAFAATHHAVAKHHQLVKKHDDAASAAPAEGIFDACDLNSALSTCEQRLQVMSQAGLEVVVMNVGDSTEANIQAYAAAAQSAGMSVMWELNDPGYWGGSWIGSSAAADDPQFAQACGCTDTTGVLDAMIQFLASQPGTYGYYAADDQSIESGQSAGLKTYVSEIKAIDPNHMVMVGDFAEAGESNAGAGAVLGNEIYPETTSNIANQGNNLATWDMVQQTVSQGQAAATKHDQASAYILQAFTFGDNLDDGEAVDACTASMTQQQCYQKLLYPSEQVQLKLRNEVLEHSHPKLILWYSFDGTYGQSGDDTYSIYPTGAVAQARWAGLTKAINAPLPQPTATAANAKHHAKRHAAKSSHKAGRHHKLASHKRHAVTG